jgi:hypothetical protein
VTEPSGPDRPLLRVVKGNPTPEEVAALVAVLAARQAAAVPVASAPRQSGWASRRAALRRPVNVGPGEWAASGFEAGTRTRAAW